MGEVKRNIIKIISLVFVVCAIALQVTNNMSKEELYDDTYQLCLELSS